MDTKTKNTTTVKRTTAKKVFSKDPNAQILKDLPLSLLSPEQYEAITKANYYHPESRLVLELFLHTDYLWQLARKIQNKSTSIEFINWAMIEKNTAKAIDATLQQLLNGVRVEARKIAEPKHKARKRLACGCTQHSDAAGVVEACMLGQEQGRDELWTGY